MSTNKDKKILAQELFISGAHTRKSISEMVGVTEKTLRKWIEEGDWEKMKDLKSVTRSQLLRDSYAQLKAVNKKIASLGGVPTKELYDAKSIIGKEIERLGEHAIAVYIECFSEFTGWLLRNHPKESRLFGNLMLEFLEAKQREHSR
ncbi:MAG: hypothetical protein E6Q66_05885 [Pedobacter sp.]|nr:MAG: hypothetical protein E6Q66_05885 [Pedobacter sp.]